MVLLLDFIYCDQIDLLFRISPNENITFSINIFSSNKSPPSISPIYHFKIDHSSCGVNRRHTGCISLKL